MNDNDVIKALECCGVRRDCAGCPKEEQPFGCYFELTNNALDLINLQKEEIDRLTIELQAMRGAANSYKMHYEKAKAERNLLNLKIRDLNKERVELSKEHWNDWEIHCNAIAEFGEALKVKLPYITSHLGNVSVMTLHRQIDNLIKEMTQKGGGADA